MESLDHMINSLRTDIEQVQSKALKTKLGKLLSFLVSVRAELDADMEVNRDAILAAYNWVDPKEYAGSLK